MSIEGKTIVFTGKISKPRYEFEQLVAANGGRFGTSVTGGTDYLVLGENPGSKLAVATQLGTNVVSEQEFLKLLEAEAFDEEPLSKEELAELQSRIVYLTCKWCDCAYKQWDTLPNYETCPVCEILSQPICPKCSNSDPVFVAMSVNYYCYKCHVFFDAPHSDAVEYIEHIHILNDDLRCVVCRKVLPLSEKIRPGKVLESLREQRQVQERTRNTQREATWREAKRLEKWFESLSEEQIEELRKGDENGED